MSWPRRRGAHFLLLFGASCAVVPSCASSLPPSTSEPPETPWPAGAEMVLTFDDAAGPGAVLPGTRDRGRIPSTTAVTTRAGGRVVVITGPEGGAAVRFPATSAQGDSSPPSAAILVTASEAIDPLEPGEHDFSFGADISIDATSEGPGDNGDNLLQRGLFLDDAQYKLQFDHRRPSCRIAGADGSAFVKADVTTVPGDWYRLVCSRIGGELRLEMLSWDGASWGDARQWTVPADVGNISFARDENNGTAPVSIGAKVDAAGRIPVSSGDQFNGSVDNVFVDVLGFPGVGGAQ